MNLRGQQSPCKSPQGPQRISFSNETRGPGLGDGLGDGDGDGEGLGEGLGDGIGEGLIEGLVEPGQLESHGTFEYGPFGLQNS